MTELLYQDMQKEKIIAALKELKSIYHSRPPSKYYFALGHAIRLFENAKHRWERKMLENILKAEIELYELLHKKRHKHEKKMSEMWGLNKRINEIRELLK